MITKDLTRAILFSVILFVTHSWVGQIPILITGIPGIGYTLIIINIVIYSVAGLLFEGRRWRIFFMTGIIVALTLPLYLGGRPYDIISRLPILISAFFFDLIFNSVYKMFEIKKHLDLWIICGVTFNFMASTLLAVPVNLIFYTPEVVQILFDTTSIFLPIILIESIIGGYIGYKIFSRIKTSL